MCVPLINPELFDFQAIPNAMAWTAQGHWKRRSFMDVSIVPLTCQNWVRKRWGVVTSFFSQIEKESNQHEPAAAPALGGVAILLLLCLQRNEKSRATENCLTVPIVFELHPTQLGSVVRWKLAEDSIRFL
jgi:hypothetical protein